VPRSVRRVSHGRFPALVHHRRIIHIVGADLDLVLVIREAELYQLTVCAVERMAGTQVPRASLRVAASRGRPTGGGRVAVIALAGS